MQFIIDSLSKSYSKKEVLKKVSFTFESGKIYGLLGRNGAGKTTLFNCLNGDIPRDGGDFWFSEAGARRAVRPDDIGYVLSTPTVPEFLTGREFLKFFLDINTATVDELDTLPGIGEVLAERIVAYCEAHGPFPSVDALDHVEGIGEGTLAPIRRYLTAE